jgi:hypothetical protein
MTPSPDPARPQLPSPKVQLPSPNYNSHLLLLDIFGCLLFSIIATANTTCRRQLKYYLCVIMLYGYRFLIA